MTATTERDTNAVIQDAFHPQVQLTGVFLVSQGLFAIALATSHEMLLRVALSLAGLVIAIVWSAAAKSRLARMEDSFAARSMSMLLPLAAIIGWSLSAVIFLGVYLNRPDPWTFSPGFDVEVIEANPQYID